MNEVKPLSKPSAPPGPNVTQSVSDKGQSGFRSTQQTADKALNRVGGEVAKKTEEPKTDTSPLPDKTNDQLQELLQQGREKFDEASRIVREKVARASDMAISYTREEPIKGILMAAAAGALAMHVLSSMARPRR